MDGDPNFSGEKVEMKETQERTFDHEFGDAYRRIPGMAVERIRQARVMALGVGALGNETLKNLALYDIGSLFLCDMDTVEWANLSHSVLFGQEDDGKPKVDAAARSLHRLNPRVTVRTFHGSLSEIGLGVWRAMDVIVGGLDNRGSRLLIDRACAQVGKDWLDAGLGAMVSGENSAADILHGVVQRFSPRQGYSYEYYLQGDIVRAAAEQEAAAARKAYRNWPGCYEMNQAARENQRVPTTPSMAGLIGAIQAQETIRSLDPHVWGQGGVGLRRLMVNADSYSFQLMEHPKGQPKMPLEPIISNPRLSARRTTLREMWECARQDLGERAIVHGVPSNWVHAVNFAPIVTSRATRCPAVRCGVISRVPSRFST
jgi:hypothetical protein